jgi:hypothetical protein
MLGTLIEKLSALISKGAFVASFVPLLAFVAVNSSLLAAVHPPTRAWLTSHRTDPEFLGGAVLAFLVGSLVFATVNTRLRELMEGRFWPQRMCSRFVKDQQDRLLGLQDQNRRLQRNLRGLRRATQWTESLKKARGTEPKIAGRTYDRSSATGRLIDELRERRARGEVIDADSLQKAVGGLADELHTTTIGPGLNEQLDADQFDLNEFIRFSGAKNRFEFNRIFNEIQFNFPDYEVEPLAPTAMGNIALSIRSYARSRYRINLETFWTRLQKVMQGEAFYGVLQDGKVQLDFLVSLYWLSLVSVVGWGIALALFGFSLWLYLAIVIAGPFVIWGAYRLALQNYQAFADLMRSSIDMYRLRLLKELYMPQPSGSQEEKFLWVAVQDRMDYGKDFNVSYRRPE